MQMLSAACFTLYPMCLEMLCFAFTQIAVDHSRKSLFLRKVIRGCRSVTSEMFPVHLVPSFLVLH